MRAIISTLIACQNYVLACNAFLAAISDVFADVKQLMKVVNNIAFQPTANSTSKLSGFRLPLSTEEGSVTLETCREQIRTIACSLKD